MTRTLFVTVLILLGSLIYSQEKIAIFPFEDMDNILTKNDPVLFYRQFSNEFSKRNAGKFIIVPRQDVDKLIDTEMNFQLSDLSEKVKTADYQRVLNGTRILREILDAATDKFVILDLSSSIITEIPDFAFIDIYADKGCDTLVGITIPESVTSLGNYAFDCCAGLTSVTFSGNNLTVANFGSNVFPEGIYGFGENTLKNAYNAASSKEGTYTREANGSLWTKQP